MNEDQIQRELALLREKLQVFEMQLDATVEVIARARASHSIDRISAKFHGLEPPEFPEAQFEPAIQAVTEAAQKVTAARVAIRAMEDALERLT